MFPPEVRTRGSSSGLKAISVFGMQSKRGRKGSIYHHKRRETKKSIRRTSNDVIREKISRMCLHTFWAEAFVLHGLTTEALLVSFLRRFFFSRSLSYEVIIDWYSSFDSRLIVRALTNKKKARRERNDEQVSPVSFAHHSLCYKTSRLEKITSVE
jgi:hypothetical protein